MTAHAPRAVLARRAAPSGRPDGGAPADRLPRRVELGALALLVVAALALWAWGRTYPNYDTYYALVWGRELLDGTAPSFEAYAAPTQHPLWLALGAIAGGVLGESADRALVLCCLLCWVGLIAGTYRLGAACLGRWSGALGAAFAAGSASFLLYGVRGYVDMPFLALVVWAGALEAQRPRRGPAVMTLLTLAGLLRPEAWVLAALYLGWCAWPALPERLRVLVARVPGVRRTAAPPPARAALRPSLTLAALAALAALAPAIWVAVDGAVTGDPLHSLHATSMLAEDLGRERGLGAVPGSFVSFLASTVRAPVFALGLIGLPLAVATLGWVRPRLPLALVAAGVATFAGTGVAGLSILPRYLTVPAVALSLFAGFALAGWTALSPHDRRRGPWRNAAIAAAVTGAAALAILAPTVDRVSGELTFLRTTHRELSALLRSPAVTAARRCGPITFPSYRLVPDARWILDARRGEVGARSARRRRYGVAIFVTTVKGLRRFGFADGVATDTNVPDPGYVPIERRGRFTAYASCPER